MQQEFEMSTLIEKDLKKSSASVISRVDVFDYLRTPASLETGRHQTLYERISLVKDEDIPIAAEMKVKQMHSRIKTLF